VTTTLAQAYEGFLANAAHLDHLRPHTLRAYRYELALAAAASRFAGDRADRAALGRPAARGRLAQDGGGRGHRADALVPGEEPELGAGARVDNPSM